MRTLIMALFLLTFTVPAFSKSVEMSQDREFIRAIVASDMFASVDSIMVKHNFPNFVSIEKTMTGTRYGTYRYRVIYQGIDPVTDEAIKAKADFLTEYQVTNHRPKIVVRIITPPSSLD